MSSSRALKSGLLITLILFVIAATSGEAGSIPNTLFTYQGELKDDGDPVEAASARLLFRLWDRDTGGNQIGPEWEAHPVEIVEGLFTVQVDFGEGAFTDELRWLEIGVDPLGGTEYHWFTTRQMMTAAPLATYALNALHGGDTHWTLNGTTLY